MAKLLLEKNEFTVETLLENMVGKYGAKTNGVPFSKSDIHDWGTKGRIPRFYGGDFVRVEKVGPLKVLVLSQEPHESNEEAEIEIKQKD